MKFKLIAALTEDSLIGVGDELAMTHPDDFKQFRKMTANSYMVVGRSTFDTFKSPLPPSMIDRHIVVLSRTKPNEPTANNVTFVTSFEEMESVIPDDATVWCCGGSEIYLQMMDRYPMEEMHLTLWRNVNLGNKTGKCVYFPDPNYSALNQDSRFEYKVTKTHNKYFFIVGTRNHNK